MELQREDRGWNGLVRVFDDVSQATRIECLQGRRFEEDKAPPCSTMST